MGLVGGSHGGCCGLYVAKINFDVTALETFELEQLLKPFLISILPQQPLQLLVWFRRLRKSPSLRCGFEA
uniref:Uncharacterized protein n=1 Tax=Pristionchus pacificus TaxID=54126 RepID=A0A2A6BV01_PRIPA|eukprot:PDM69744.1 hypothetical protein PRIPAC_44840 [Pristionchus pacificus]